MGGVYDARHSKDATIMNNTTPKKFDYLIRYTAKYIAEGQVVSISGIGVARAGDARTALSNVEVASTHAVANLVEKFPRKHVDDSTLTSMQSQVIEVMEEGAHEFYYHLTYTDGTPSHGGNARITPPSRGEAHYVAFGHVVNNMAESKQLKSVELELLYYYGMMPTASYDPGTATDSSSSFEYAMKPKEDTGG
jgi:hypothetical protein